LARSAGGPRVSPERHRTVRATVEWSYDLLDPVEQRAFRSLAVFVGGFDAVAALAVAPAMTVDGFARLVDKSVVVARETPRYRLLETVREWRPPDRRERARGVEWAADSDPCAGIAMFAATRDLFQMLGQADGRRIADTLPDQGHLTGRGPHHRRDPCDGERER
jgi:hypothetical protein